MRRLLKLQIALFSAIGWAIVSCIVYLPTQARSSEASSDRNIRNSNISQRSPDFSSEGRPGRRTGGGSRSLCPTVATPLTALIPMSNLGKTVAERPTFWFYVPYSARQAPVGEFVLQSEHGNDIYRTAVTLPQTPGLVSFSMPPTAAPLEIERSYRWYFKLYCEPELDSTPVFVEGWVRRVEPTATLKSQLRSASERKYSVYAANGIWYDALAHLARLRLERPVNDRLDREWMSLLDAKGVGLEQFSKLPIVGSVQIEQQIGTN